RQLHAWLGGHPGLTQRGLHALATARGGLPALLEAGEREDGPFAAHLRRLLTSLARSPELCEAVRALLADGTAPDAAAFYRLRSAGVLAGDNAAAARPRCELYGEYLARNL